MSLPEPTTTMKLDVSYKITDQEIRVETDSTLFLSARPAQIIPLDSFELSLFKMKQLCKQSKVKLKSSDADQLVKEYQFYLEDCAEVNRLFSELKKIAEEISNEGITAPTIGNEKLKAASTIQNKINSFYFRSRIMSRFSEKYDLIQNWLKRGVSDIQKIWI